MHQPRQGSGARDWSSLRSSQRSPPILPDLAAYGTQPSPINYDGATNQQLLQAQYLAQIQQQILLQQSQLLAGQQAEAEAAMQAMTLQQPAVRNYGGALFTPGEEAELSKNPLALSALNRRKRQSFTVEQAAQVQQQAPLVAHHRRTSSTSFTSKLSQHSSDFSGSTTTAGSSPTTSEPPALVLSKPGEAFPATAVTSPSASSDRAQDLILSQKPTKSTLSSSAAVFQPSSPTPKSPSARPSQANALNAVLANRKARPASINLSQTAHYSPSEGWFERPFSAAPARSFSGTSSSSSGSSLFSPFPETVRPRSPPESEPVPSSRAFTPVGPAGHATAIRQPKGPASELGTTNFASRLRKQAIESLLKSPSRAAFN